MKESCIFLQTQRADQKLCWAICCCLFPKLCPTLWDPWTVACQAPLSLGFSRQEYWSGLPVPSPGDLSDLGIELASPALAGRFFTTELPGKPLLAQRSGPFSVSTKGHLSPQTLHQGTGLFWKENSFSDCSHPKTPYLPRSHVNSSFHTIFRLMESI